MTLSDVKKAKAALHSLPIEWDDRVFDTIDAFLANAESYILKRDKHIPMLLRSVK